MPGSSHAEATLAGRSDVTIGFDFIVVEARIEGRMGSTTGDENGWVDFHSGNLVGDSWAVGDGGADDDGKQESEDSVLHGWMF